MCVEIFGSSVNVRKFFVKDNNLSIVGCLVFLIRFIKS